MGDQRKPVKVEDVLTDNQICQIVKKCVGEAAHYQLAGCDMTPAVQGLAGFGGDHFRLTLKVRVADRLKIIPLFVKSMPINNAPRMEFIVENKLFIREMTIFRLIEEMETGSTPCVMKAIFCNEQVLVMPDLTYEGYSIRNQLETLDLPHVLVALTSVARFHAAITDLETRRGLQHPYSFMDDHGHVMIDRSFIDSPWIRAAAKLTANIVQHLSDKYRNTISDLETNVFRQFVAGSEDLTESSSLNVVLHRDLWVNNIMFKYEGAAPSNAILLDFQCARYGPPAFDVMIFLYLTTSRSFRSQHESAVLRHYFGVFTESLSSDSRIRLRGLGYDYEDFLRWVIVARRFGMAYALVISPSVLMDAQTAGSVFDNAEEYDRLMYEDRTEVVLAQVRRCPEYGRRLLELTEEFLERYLRV